MSAARRDRTGYERLDVRDQPTLQIAFRTPGSLVREWQRRLLSLVMLLLHLTASIWPTEAAYTVNAGQYNGYAEGQEHTHGRSRLRKVSCKHDHCPPPYFFLQQMRSIFISDWIPAVINIKSVVTRHKFSPWPVLFARVDGEIWQVFLWQVSLLKSWHAGLSLLLLLSAWRLVEVWGRSTLWTLSLVVGRVRRIRLSSSCVRTSDMSRPSVSCLQQFSHRSWKSKSLPGWVAWSHTKGLANRNDETVSFYVGPPLLTRFSLRLLMYVLLAWRQGHIVTTSSHRISWNGQGSQDSRKRWLVAPMAHIPIFYI